VGVRDLIIWNSGIIDDLEGFGRKRLSKCCHDFNDYEQVLDCSCGRISYFDRDRYYILQFTVIYTVYYCPQSLLY
jgi:hypothetical protein